MDKLTEKLQTILERSVAAGEMAGANLLILRHGEEIAYAQAGFADVEQKKPFARDTISRLYSMSKPITAAAAMLLVQDGLLDLEQPLSGVLPGFRNLRVWEDNRKVPASREIFVSDLLNMTSGLPYPADDAAGQEAAMVFEDLGRRLHGENPMTTMEFAQRIGGCALSFQPGAKWMYGTSADILGAVVEAVSGQRFGSFLKERIFDPLGMEDTGFYVPTEKQHRLAEVYEQTPDGVKRFETYNLGIDYQMTKSPAFESGGAGLASTVEDYGKFARMLIRNGDGLMSPAAVKRMTQARLLPWQQESAWRSWDGLAGYGYGSLMRILEEPGMARVFGWKGEYGWDGWLGCYFINSPENGISVLMTTQRRDAGTLPVTRKLRNALAAEL